MENQAWIILSHHKMKILWCFWKFELESLKPLSIHPWEFMLELRHYTRISCLNVCTPCLSIGGASIWQSKNMCTGFPFFWFFWIFHAQFKFGQTQVWPRFWQVLNLKMENEALILLSHHKMKILWWFWKFQLQSLKTSLCSPMRSKGRVNTPISKQVFFPSSLKLPNKFEELLYDKVRRCPLIFHFVDSFWIFDAHFKSDQT